MAAAKASADLRLPITAVVPGARLVQPFGCTPLSLEPFDPYCPTRHFHSGIDLAAPSGTSVFVAAGGAAASGFDPTGCGLYVAVAVDAHVRMLYCHLRHPVVTTGAVSTGDLVGTVGSSGLATGPHLHLEIDIDGRAVDPVAWLAS
jgi:murein DD-endopeptidase MepM/ murein hydrolase activator NlpD